MLPRLADSGNTWGCVVINIPIPLPVPLEHGVRVLPQVRWGMGLDLGVAVSLSLSILASFLSDKGDCSARQHTSDVELYGHICRHGEKREWTYALALLILKPGEFGLRFRGVYIIHGGDE